MEESRVYRAHSIQEIQHILREVKNIVPVAGGTTFSVYADDRRLNIGDEILALNSTPQLRIMNKSDRYIDFGSCVTLDEILNRGRRHVPSVLYDALDRAGNMAIRGVATIGGNFAMKNPFTASFLPLLALDAQCEVCNGREVFWQPASKYINESAQEEGMGNKVLLRIRVKDDEWTYQVYKKIKNGQYINKIPIFLFLIKAQKNVISEVRLLFADEHLIRAKEADNLLLGRSLPISKEEIVSIILQMHEIFPKTEFSSLFVEKCFFNMLEKSLYKM